MKALEQVLADCHGAEKAAGVAHRPWRALHGLRRMVVGDVFGVTGSLELAGEFVGQRDVDQARGYLRDRGRRQDTAAALDRHQTVTASVDAGDGAELSGAGAGSSVRATGRSRTDDRQPSKRPTGGPNRTKVGKAAQPSARKTPDKKAKPHKQTVTRPSPFPVAHPEGGR